MPFICLTRSDIPPGILQVLDLVPNTSRRNLIYDPPGQTKYVSFRPQNDAVYTIQPGGGGNPILAGKEFKGLAAYLIDRIEDTPNGDALTAAQANTIAGDIIANLLDTASAATTTAINAEVAATVTGSGIGLGNSTATLEDILRILSGDEYVLPSQAQVDTDGSTFDATIRGSFTFGTLGRVRRTYSTGALNISLGSGHLSEFVDPNFEYIGVTGRAVVVYADDGTVLG